jgi:PAS domain-containing protein
MAAIPNVVVRCPQCQCSLTQVTLEHGSDAALWTEGQDGLLHANQAAARLLGYDQQELMALRLDDVAPELAGRLESTAEGDVPGHPQPGGVGGA